ncbi:MAG TPA: RNase adapter RapZ [Opitutaceae bacterium]|nr:RNase adapter RapZ [Opitutaceae bacterium]
MHARLSALFARHFGAAPSEIGELRAHGSDRKLFRLRAADGRTAVGVEHADHEENAAFLGFSRHFRAAGLPVPAIYAEDLAADVYLEEDLGDETLFDALQRLRGDSPDIPPPIVAVYEQAVRLLARLQIQAGRDLDYRLCHPHSAFDRRSMMWDLNYFKYYFLKLAKIPFHEQRLESDFDALCGLLLQAPAGFFLYRDFQSRNIMVRDGQPWFIDYQGGRRGALPYDLASLVLDAKANLPFAFRDHLKAIYLRAASELTAIDPAQFADQFRGFSLIRLLQALGAYGYRGFYERKPHFLQSVPFAIRNLERLLAEGPLRNHGTPVPLPELQQALHRLVASAPLRALSEVAVPLTVRVESFAYARGYPADASGHGGGFIFDCRALPNPGREPAFARLTGRDAEVADWLRRHDEVGQFLAQTQQLLEPVLAAYQQRRFTHLSVAFGCTGGRHRSVYCAEALAQWLRGRAGVTVEVHHRDQDTQPAAPAA